MRRTILKIIVITLSFLSIGCNSTMRVPVYTPPKPVHIEPDSLRPIFTLADKANYRDKSEAIVHSYAQCEARVDYLQRLKS